MVFVAVSIPKLASNETSFFRASLEGHSNNIHCLAYAINHIFGALFTICDQGDIEDRMKELLAVGLLILLIRWKYNLNFKHVTIVFFYILLMYFFFYS